MDTLEPEHLTPCTCRLTITRDADMTSRVQRFPDPDCPLHKRR